MLFTLFWGFSFFAAAACGIFLTADCVSDEKREGTLGLLFLTDLRGYDVVVGKLSTRSLQAAYAFLAAFPVVSITFTLGGVGAGEFVRSLLVLAVTAFQSLSVGLLISVASRDATRAMTATLLALLGIHLGLPLLDAAICELRKIPSAPITSFVSPMVAMSEVGALRLGIYWNSILATTGTAAAALGIASWALPRSWQDVADRRRARKGGAGTSARARLDRNPSDWLASRRVWLTRASFLLVLATAAYLCWEYYRLQTMPKPTPGTPMTIRQGPVLVPMLVMLLFRLWIVIEAARFWLEAKSTGALELLQTTPLRLPDLLAGQWKSLVRRFVLPLGLLAALVTGGGWLTHLAQEAYLRALWSQSAVNMTPDMVETSIKSMRKDILISLAAQGITSITTILALARFAVWMAMTSRRLHVAALKALLFADLLPAIGLGLVELASNVWMAQQLSSMGLEFSYRAIALAVAAIGLDLFLAELAFRRASRRALHFATDGAER